MTDLVEGRWPVARCESARCAARIVWAVTEAGKRMPIDADPSPEGSIRLAARSGAEPLARVVKVAARFGAKTLHASHFATCPDAGLYRRRRF